MSEKPRVRLHNQGWLTADATQKVMTLLNARQPDCARFVGGCVRNALMGAPVKDVDIATQLEPDIVIETLTAASVNVHKTGYEHGTVTAVCKGQTFEITSLRRDVETDGRRAVIAYTTDWTEDAQRRDFRVNALYASADGWVHDPIGHGLEDLEARRIVFIGDPLARIREDYLRILRFFRFNAWYGRGEPDRAGLEACAELSPGLKTVSSERVWSELQRLLEASDPRRSIKAMADLGVMDELLPDAWGLALFNELVAIELAAGLSPDAIVRLLSFYSRDEQVLVHLADRLRMSNAEKRRMLAAAHDETPLRPDMDASRIRQALYLLGEQAFRDRVRLVWAASSSKAPFSRWFQLYKAADGWRRPSFPICGEDVIAAGVAPGPHIGEVLRRVEAWWVVNDFCDDKPVLMQRMHEVARDVVDS